LKNYVDVEVAYLSSVERKIIEPPLNNYAGIFQYGEYNDFKGTNVVVYKIETGYAHPKRKAPHKTSFPLRKEMYVYVQKMLDKGVISPNHSPCSSPVVLVPKKSEN
jgi:hypothetical protein